MIPDYQTLMKPVLEMATTGDVNTKGILPALSEQLKLTEEEMNTLLPSGKQTTFYSRVHWAKTYLTKAGLLETTRRGYFKATQRGQEALTQPDITIDNDYLKQFDEFTQYVTLSRQSSSTDNDLVTDNSQNDEHFTPDESLRLAHKKINAALATDLLDRVINSSPSFFEHMILELLIAMGYGGSTSHASRILGKSGDNGIDGVIDQDPLGVDQIYLQAKRYALDNKVGSSDIRDFFGALNLKRAQKGIFITTSSFTSSAISTANDLSNRIVLIDGQQLSQLMVKYNIGCQTEETLVLKKVDEDFFE